jgi:hypothetical protein
LSKALARISRARTVEAAIETVRETARTVISVTTSKRMH